MFNIDRKRPNPPNRRIRTRTSGGVGGEESRDFPPIPIRPLGTPAYGGLINRPAVSAFGQTGH
jgi:hypothetical protein